MELQRIGLAGVFDYLIPLHQQRDSSAEKAGSRMNAVIFLVKNTVGTEIVHFTQEDAITFRLSCKAGFMKLKSLCMNRNITAGKKQSL